VGVDREPALVPFTGAVRCTRAGAGLRGPRCFVSRGLDAAGRRRRTGAPVGAPFGVEPGRPAGEALMKKRDKGHRRARDGF